MHTVLSINESSICHLTVPSIWTSEYHNYCVRLLTAALPKVHKPVNIILGDIAYDFRNAHKTIKIDIQSEHTLVKLGGRSVDEIVFGNVSTQDGGKYLIRVPNYKYYSSLDATIEYSLPNMFNLQTNIQFSDYLKRAVYIAPVIYDTTDFTSDEKTATISMFSSNPCERRSTFSAVCKDVINVQGLFSREHLKQVYNKTKIMVNVHQTDHHHTFEELRVLPALCNGVVIVSEDVPLKHTVPYNKSIVWSPYGDLAQTVRDVQANYKHYYDSIFTNDLKEEITRLNDGNIDRMIKLIRQIA